MPPRAIGKAAAPPVLVAAGAVPETLPEVLPLGPKVAVLEGIEPPDKG